MNKDLEFLTRVIDEKSAKILDALSLIHISEPTRP